jgi:hypothetical protein
LAVQSLPTFLSDLIPLLLVFVYSLHVFLIGVSLCWSAFPLPCNPRLFLPIPAIVTLAFVLKPFSHSTENLLTGTFSQFIFSHTDSSLLSFVPDGGKKVVPSIFRGLRISDRPSYRAKFGRNRLMTTNEPCFYRVAKNVTLPTFFPRWPRYATHVTPVENGVRRLDFHMTTLLRDSVEMVIFAVYCPNRTRCVEKWDGQSEVNYINTRLSETTVAVRVVGLTRRFNVSFLLNTEAKVLVDIIYAVGRKTQARSTFMTEYQRNVQHATKSDSLGGTVFVQTSKY